MTTKEVSPVIGVARFIGLTIGLGVMGFILAIPGIFLGGRVLGDGSFASLGLAILGAMAGYVVGIILGLMMVKRVFHINGSLWLGVLGAFIGAVILLPIPAVFDFTIDIIAVLFLVIVPVCGLAGFLLRHRS